ncbi:hypothetical protein DEIPH_ctg052orf0019 [Deinococcus phoenicis]|uniref:Uncharacterized protein n=1 Tax=Deinococcus phoenicis TaxID=1476583 RepID=A0A016QMQ4_9DEIO|nr:hypothetical protein [Deinococcus phoenicis]EYB67024.1 hypothetical protein DEIPH_ctg052orf0019 [Deinococcus phoenicis]
MDDLSAEMRAIQAQFQAGFSEQAGFFYPYPLTPTPGIPFRGNVWAADVRGSAYARAVQQMPTLAAQDVRFLTVAPGEDPPGERAIIPFDGGRLTLHFWAQLDPMSGEAIAACSWVL